MNFGKPIFTGTDKAWGKIAGDWLEKEMASYTPEEWAMLELACEIEEFDAKTSQCYKLNFLTGEYYR